MTFILFNVLAEVFDFSTCKINILCHLFLSNVYQKLLKCQAKHSANGVFIPVTDYVNTEMTAMKCTSV